MSAQDAQNMFSVDPNTLVDQYRLKLSEQSHHSMLLENALQNVQADRERLRQENDALQKQLEALTSDAGPEPAPAEAVNGSLVNSGTPD